MSASFTVPVARLGIPALLETDASLGVAWVNGVRGDGATALPASLSLAASGDPALAYRGSALIAREARAKGFNVLLSGGINLTREPRGGRNFEYMGEDPLLAGVLTGETIRAMEASHMISTIKHFAVNPQETARHVVNSRLSDAAGIVLLKNDSALPLLKTARRVAVIGGYASTGVVSAAGPSISLPANGENRRMMYHSSAPLAAIKAKLGKDARVRFDQGFSPASAAALARYANVVIVFATQWMTEGVDAPDLSLPQGQDTMIAAVAAANPRTIVVLEPVARS